MSFSERIDQIHARVRSNKWYRYFTYFCRVALAAGFLPSGMQKVMGERFTVLANEHPMGAFLEAIFHTGYYYTFVGVMQVLAAILLLIPRTALLGAFIYFPIILNICILSYAVRFDGSMFTAPLMVLACLYLICWDYHKFKFIFPWNHTTAKFTPIQPEKKNNKFPFLFFIGVFLTAVSVLMVIMFAFTIVPHNTIKECKSQCAEMQKPETCIQFCDCIHKEGKSLDHCLEEYGF